MTPPDDLPDRNAETYLGDGLYASFDGFQVILRAPRANPYAYGDDHYVGLEPPVYQALLAWVARYPRLRRHLENG